MTAAANTAARLLCEIVTGVTTVLPPGAEDVPLLDTANQHRLRYLLVWQCRQQGINLEEWLGAAGQALWEDARAACATEAVAAAELGRVLTALADVKGAMPVLFKGAALAYSHYPEPWLRPRLDADIIVGRSCVTAVFDLLRALGYEQQPQTSGALVSYQSSFARSDRFGLIHNLDVHWKISNRQLLSDVISHEELASRAVPLPALGRSARGAAARDALVLGCLHRAAHHHDSPNLLWIHDIHLIAERISDADCHEIRRLAERRNIRGILARGLALSLTSFGTRLPAAFTSVLDEWQRLAAREPSRLYLDAELRPVQALWADVQNLGVSAGARLVYEHLFPPAGYMHQKYVGRSRLMTPLRYAYRIVAGAPKWLRRRDGS